MLAEEAVSVLGGGGGSLAQEVRLRPSVKREAAQRVRLVKSSVRPRKGRQSNWLEAG